MPKDTDKDLPGTVRRSPAKARRTFRKALESAHEQYDSEERAHRTAFAALKHSFEKVGDHWEPKDQAGRPGGRPVGGRRRRAGPHQAGAVRAGQEARRTGALVDVQAGAGPGDRPQAGLTELN
jgi:cation transport regulator ChaB